MTSGNPRVYVIDSPTSDVSNVKAETRSSAGEAKKKSGPSQPAQRKRNTSKGWKPMLMAYLLGPVVLPFKFSGRRRTVLSVIGPGVFGIGITLLVFRSYFATRLEAGYYGISIWLITVTVIVLLLVTTWALSIASVSAKRNGKGSKQSRWIRDPRFVSFLGFIIPGLGLVAAGHPRRAAWAFWILGPLAVALIVLFNWRWLWDLSRTSAAPGIMGSALETIFAVAAGVAVVGILSWIVQALEGARLVSSHRSNRFGDAVGVALLVSFMLLVVFFRPTLVAQHLHAASNTLQRDGFQLLPLKLNEAAARLDPATPAYLMRAAELNEKMGEKDAALAKREILERRALEYKKLIPKRDGDSNQLAKEYIETTDKHPPILDGPPDVFYRATEEHNDEWSQIRALLQ